MNLKAKKRRAHKAKAAEGIFGIKDSRTTLQIYDSKKDYQLQQLEDIRNEKNTERYSC